MATIDDVRKCLSGNTSKDPRQRVNEVIAICEQLEPESGSSDVQKTTEKVRPTRGKKSD